MSAGGHFRDWTARSWISAYLASHKFVWCASTVTMNSTSGRPWLVVLLLCRMTPVVHGPGVLSPSLHNDRCQLSLPKVEVSQIQFLAGVCGHSVCNRDRYAQCKLCSWGCAGPCEHAVTNSAGFSAVWRGGGEWGGAGCDFAAVFALRPRGRECPFFGARQYAA